jgi:hypothetical protein
MGCPGELLRHGVAHMAPAGEQRKPVDLMTDQSSETPAIQPRKASPAILVGSVQVFIEHQMYLRQGANSSVYLRRGQARLIMSK